MMVAVRNKLLFLILFSLFGCNESSYLPCEESLHYVKFDEYKLLGVQEVDANGNIKVCINNDSMYVQIDKNRVIKYVNIGDAWFCEFENILPVGQSTASYWTRRFIKNDTIVEYNFTVVENDTLNIFAKVRTKEKLNERILTSLPYESSFNHVCKVVMSGDYKLYNKRIRDNVIFYYEKDVQETKYKLGCLYSAYSLSSLGEYGLAFENSDNIAASFYTSEGKFCE